MNNDMSEGNDANDETATTTTEINLLLDGDGRTTYDPALFPPHRGRTEAVTTTTANDDDGNPNKRARGADDPPGDRPAPSSSSSSSSLDYSSKTALTNLASMAIPSSSPPLPSSQQRDPYDELLFDCEIADCGMMPRTYWVSPDDDDDHPPRCFLERLALDVFHRHVPPPTSSDGGGCCCYDPRSSGAEWWVQIRPSPPGTGRYSMLSTTGDGYGMVDSGGIDFHWDKDEELWKMCGGSVFVHPHVSTVTYLTDLGAPTVVLSRRVDAATGRYLDDGDGPSTTTTSSARTEGFVSWPRRGKHLSFDGRMLHAAPSDLMEEGSFERQCADPRDDDDDDDDAAVVATGDGEDDGDRTRKTLARRRRRVTFLVNVWLNHRPIGVMPFPDGMVGKLRGSDLFGDDFEMFDEDDGGGDDRNAGAVAPRGDHPATTTTTTKVIVKGGVASLVEGRTPSAAADDDDDDGRCRKVDQTRNDGIELTKMVWPMGGGEEDGSIEALVPLDLIRAKGKTGSDVAITWMDGFVLGGVGA